MKRTAPVQLLLLTLLGWCIMHPATAQEVHSFGIFTGITSPYTLDGGITKDPRYKNAYSVKFLPIGVHYGLDLDGYGFTVDPQITRMGQRFIILNTVGGHVGERDADLTYIQLPVGFKLHLIDLSFFKVSFVSSLSAGLLLKGKETISHSAAKIYFPTAVYPTLQNDPRYNGSYTIVYDGVLVPEQKSLVLTTKSDYKSIQFFGAVGLRSDWDVSEEWRLSFDLRANYGFTDPRTSDYTNRIKNHTAVYDQYGSRRELFMSLTFGVARTLEITPHEKKRKSPRIKSFKGRSQKRRPTT